MLDVSTRGAVGPAAIASFSITTSVRAMGGYRQTTPIPIIVLFCNVIRQLHHTGREFSDLLLSERGTGLDWRHPADSVKENSISAGWRAGGKRRAISKGAS
jgi:hypothetical protein